MQIKTAKLRLRYYHRSWFQWWETIYYYKLISATSEDSYEQLAALDDMMMHNAAIYQYALYLVPFECLCTQAIWTMMGEHVTFVDQLDPIDWSGFRFNPLSNWVTSDAQFRIEWHRPGVKSKWYNDYPYSYDFDWTNGYMSPALNLACELFASVAIVPQDIGLNTTAYFARHASGLGYVPVTSYSVYRHVVSNNTRRWGY